MILSKNRLSAAAAVLLAGGIAGNAQALTVTKDLPELWIANGTLGTGATLNVYDLPQGGRQFFFAYFANDDSGNPTWVTANANTVTGINRYEGLDLIRNTGSLFDPTGNAGGDNVGTANIEVGSCNSLTLEYTDVDGASGTVDFAPLFPDTSCVWQNEFAAATCPSFAPDSDPDIPGSCILPSTLNQSVTLTNDLHWIISTNGFRFGDDLGASGGTPAVLTIEPGTVVVGDQLPANSQDIGAFFLISRGNQIVAEGTPEAPIVFTAKSHLATGDLSAGQWGGIVITGRAQTNLCTDPNNCLDEIGLNNYSGSDDNDSSGVLKYVRIEYAGTAINTEAELNGLSLYTVGDGTVIQNLHVHRNGDDGIEWFGGTANIKYALVTDVDDDSFDWTEGARHKVQYGVARMTAAAQKDARGFEGDGLQDDNTAEPRANPQFANITVFYEAGVADGPQQGLRLRRGTLGNYSNMVVTSGAGDLAPSNCLRIDDTDTFPMPTSMTIDNTVLACQQDAADLFRDQATQDIFNAGSNNVTGGDAGLTGVADGARLGANALNLIPSAASPANDIGSPNPSIFGAFFDKVNYAGAFEPGAEVDWTAGEWTNVEPDDSL